MVNSIKKGKAGERELSHELNRLLGTECRRGQQYNGLEGQDVVGLDGIHIECKRVQALNLDIAMAQSQQDAANEMAKNMSHITPVVMHRKNNRDWLVTMRLEDWVRLYRAWKARGI